MFGNIANNISNIGLGAVQRATVANADKDLGRDIAQGIADWNEFKKRKAFIDQLTSENPEDADKIMYDPEGYAKMLEDKAKLALEQQYRLEYLDKQNQNAMALEGMRNQNAIELARLQNSLKNGYDADLRAERLNFLKSEFGAGRMDEDDYKKGVLALNLGGDVYKSIYGQDKPLTLPELAKAMSYLDKAGATADAKNNLAKTSGFDLTFADAPKKYASGDLGTVQYMVDNGMPIEEAWLRVGKMTPEEKNVYEVEKAQKIGEIKLENDLTLADRRNENAIGLENLRQEGRVNLANMNNQSRLDNALALEEVRRKNAQDARLQQLSLDLQKQAAQNELKKDFETFKNTLPVDAVVKAEQISQLTGTPVNDILMQDYRANQTKARQNLADIDYKLAQTAEINRKLGQPAKGSIEEFKEKEQIKADIKAKAAEDKAERDAEKERKQNEAMKPRVVQALERAKKAIDNGSGLGQFGGLGWTTSQGGLNRSDIQEAQAQINTVMRGLLKQMGVGSTELNSAVEAAAYRYQIKQDMPLSQIKRTIENFEKDYLDGSLINEVADVAVQHGGQAPDIDVNDPRVQEALNNGYTMDQIKEYLGK